MIIEFLDYSHDRPSAQQSCNDFACGLIFGVCRCSYLYKGCMGQAPEVFVAVHARGVDFIDLIEYGKNEGVLSVS